MTSRSTPFRSPEVQKSSHLRRALAIAARGGCLLMLSSGAARANEPESPPPAKAPAQAEAPAQDEAPADDAVWGEEALAQAELPESMADAARTLEDSPLAVCSGSLQQAYRPGLLLTTLRDAEQRESLRFSGCPINDGVVMTTAKLETLRLKRATCIDNTGAATSATVSWSNGEKSTVEMTRVEMRVDGGMQVLTSEGTIRSGRHAGHAVRLVTTVPTLTTLAACVQPSGLTANQGIATLTVLDLPSDEP